jgi:hypothetical protein
MIATFLDVNYIPPITFLKNSFKKIEKKNKIKNSKEKIEKKPEKSNKKDIMTKKKTK